MNSQMERLYQETYRRAYRLRHPKCDRVKVLASIISIMLIVSSAICSYSYAVYASGNGGEMLAESENVVDVNTTMTLSAMQNSVEELSLYKTDPPEGLASKDDFIHVQDTAYMSDRTPMEIESLPNAVEEPELRATLTPEELEFVERIVEAEVTGVTYTYKGEFVSEEEMLKSKIRVVQVFLNRAEDTERFSHVMTLYDAISESGASSTVASGRYLKVEVTDLTREAVQLALDPNTEDLTDGALFFLANGATYCKYGDYLFTDSVGHSFFK